MLKKLQPDGKSWGTKYAGDKEGGAARVTKRLFARFGQTNGLRGRKWGGRWTDMRLRQRHRQTGCMAF